MKIASLEDDQDQARQIQQVLTCAGYLCDNFRQSADLLSAMRGGGYNLVLLDTDGGDALHQLRSHFGHATPVILLTSCTREEDLVQGLNAGADDFIAKPLRHAELLARISALLRRAQSAQSAFSVGAYHINLIERVITVEGRSVVLAPKEFDLAVLFFRNIGRLLSRDVLAENVWNREIPATSRTLDTHLSNIRLKLQLRAQHGVRLISSYALGYRLDLVQIAEPESGDRVSPFSIVA